MLHNILIPQWNYWWKQSAD